MAGFMPKIEPAVTQLLYLVPDGTSYIDLAKDLSKVNRRLYRQGMNYVVQDIQMFLNAGMKASDVQSIQLSTAGNSWIVHNAWKKAFRHWRKQQNEAQDALGSRIEGKWSDFKVYLDDSMEDGTTLEPYAGDAAVYQAGEWRYSKFVFDDDGTERELAMHLIGSSNLADTDNESGIALIEEYANSRPTVNNNVPDTESEASDTIYAKLYGTDEISDMIFDNLEDDNDTAPYDQDDYPGGAANADNAVPVRWISCSATQGSATVAGFVAPCGLIEVKNVEYALNDASSPDGTYATGTGQTSAILLTVASGPYRGVLAAPMGQ